ncbi:MAG: hypothetical protein QM725_02115 [Lacibacter sp.]
MMEQSGIKLPNLNEIPTQTNEKQVNKTLSEIPPKDAARILIANNNTVNSSNLIAYLQKVNIEVQKHFTKEELTQNEEAYQLILKKLQGNKTALSNSAVMLWTMGKYKAALYFFIKLAAQNTDDNLVNNYASFLTMAGAEEWAIPLLNYLDKKYPLNSTILNNLGQAWFGLGDVVNAEKYLRNAIIRFPKHPQANFTQALIEESKGNKDKAVELLKKSIEGNYSAEKENKLRKLNYKLSPADLKFSKKFKPDTDPLGLHKFKTPAIPRSYDELVAVEQEWIHFHKQVNEKSIELSKRRSQLIAPKQEKFIKDAQQYMNNSNMKTDDKEIHPAFYHQAKIMIDAMYKDGGIAFRLKSSKKAYEDYIKAELKQIVTAYNLELKKIEEKSQNISANTKREGGDESETLCNERKALITKYLQKIAPKLEELHNTYLKALKLMLTEDAFWKQYAQFPDEFERTKADYKIQFLNALNLSIPNEFKTISYCNTNNDELGNYNLADFDEFNCKDSSTLNLGWGKIKTKCNDVTTNLKIDILGLKLFEAEMKQNHSQVKDWNQEWWETAADSFVTLTIEAGPSESIGIDKGPLKLEVELEGSLVLEIGRKGITDVGVKAGANIEAGINAPDTEGDVSATVLGIETKLTVNSGFSTEGKGILK